MNNQPLPDKGFGQAIDNVISGNETVLVGSSISALFMAFCAFGVHKGWLTESDVQYLLGIATPLVVVVGVIIRQKVYSKKTVEAIKADD